MAHKVILNAYPSCCGIYILTDFYANPDRVMSEKAYATNGSYTKAQIESISKEQGWETVEEYKKRIFSEVQKFITDYTKRKCHLLITLNEAEYSILDETILSTGFEVLIPETPNPTGSVIKTYIYYLLGKPSEPKKKVSSIVGMRRAGAVARSEV